MSDLSTTNTNMLDSVVQNYNAFSWLTWDLSKELDDAIKTYKRGDVESAFCICNAYLKHNGVFQGWFSSAIWELSNSPLMVGLKQLLIHNVMTIDSMQHYFTMLVSHSKPNELAETLIGNHRQGTVISKSVSVDGCKMMGTRINHLYQDEHSECRPVSFGFFKRSSSEEELNKIWASIGIAKCS